MIGAFVGIGLLFYGIFKYKDKWLIIIGSAGILFTVLLYSSFFYVSRNFDKIIGENKKNNPLIGFSQDNLNTTVKDIEFYKLQYGVYPDSLGAIKGSMAFFDPLQAWGLEKSVKFNYEKIGDHYRLFSSGVDRIPDTKDDLYPTVVSEHTKLGFLAKGREVENH